MQREGVNIFADNIRVNPNSGTGINIKDNYPWYIVVLALVGIYYLILNFGMIIVAIVGALISGFFIFGYVIADSIMVLRNNPLVFEVILSIFRRFITPRVPITPLRQPNNNNNENNDFDPMNENNEEESSEDENSDNEEENTEIGTETSLNTI